MGIPPTAVQALQAAGLAVSDEPSINYDSLMINTTPGKASHRELLDPRVREALDMAIDRPQIGMLSIWAMPRPEHHRPAGPSPNGTLRSRLRPWTWPLRTGCWTAPGTSAGREVSASPKATR